MSVPRRFPSTVARNGRSRVSPRGRGFTYIGLLILIAVIGVATAASVQLGAVVQRRAAEEALLDIGEEFRNALISYANATPVGQKRAPSSLQDLLKDPRYPNPRRHLRKLYADPLTGKEEWGTIAWQDGSGIAGVYSLSAGRPIKVGNFDAPFQDFAGKTSYREWVFSAQPIARQSTLPPATATLSSPPNNTDTGTTSTTVQ